MTAKYTCLGCNKQGAAERGLLCSTCDDEAVAQNAKTPPAPTTMPEALQPDPTVARVLAERAHRPAQGKRVHQRRKE